MTTNESTLDRMRRLEAEGAPPTEAESFDYIAARHAASGRVYSHGYNREHYEETLEAALHEAREVLGPKPEFDPLPMRKGSGLLMWLLVFITFALLSGAVFSASYAGAQTPDTVCASKLAGLVNPSLMSRTTATRRSRIICEGLRRSAPAFFKAIVQ